MAGPKRTPDERERDLVLVAKWYIQGETQAFIAEKLNCSQQQVSYDLKELRERWRKEANINYSEAAGRELARIDVIESEAWEAWAKSKRVMTNTRLKSVPISEMKVVSDEDDSFLPASANVTVLEKVETKEESFGDPRYLAIVLKCVDQRSTILGLNQPKRELLTEAAIEHVVKLESAQQDYSASLLAVIERIEGGNTDTAAQDEG